MSVNIEETTRAEIITFLPDLIARALTSYSRYAEQPVEIDSKEFAEYHKSCKVAIAHIELLIKLAKWADKQNTQNPDPVLNGVLERAHEELAAYKEQAGENGEGDACE